MPTTQQIIAYWRDSLKDAELASLELTEGNHIRVSFDGLKKGQLDERGTAVLRASLNKESQSSSDNNPDTAIMPVVVVPIVASKGRRGHRQDTILCPLLIPAQLDEDGRLCPELGIQRPWIPRPLLEPTSSDLVLGNVDMLDDCVFSPLILSCLP